MRKIIQKIRKILVVKPIRLTYKSIYADVFEIEIFVERNKNYDILQLHKKLSKIKEILDINIETDKINNGNYFFIKGIIKKA